MPIRYLFLFKQLWNINLIAKLKHFNLIGVMSFAALTHTYTIREFKIESLILIRTNMLMSLKDVTSKLLRQIQHYLLILIYPNFFLEDAFHSAVFIINKLPTPIFHNKSPFEMVHHRKLYYNFLRASRCAYWLFLHPYNQHKMNFCLKNCICIDYSITYCCYKCLDVLIGKMYVSYHVIFYEYVFP